MENDLRHRLNDIVYSMAIKDNDKVFCKDILGLWISENEGAKIWLNNFTEMQSRGLKDILIAYSDNLSSNRSCISKYRALTLYCAPNSQ